jgi:single-strand selective monofunctional uracil DNA glycosylase
MEIFMNWKTINDNFVKQLGELSFQDPVFHCYNPMEYARETYDYYYKLYGSTKKEILFLGMNPGPWGMVQTGIPFGEITFVKEWLKIKGEIKKPAIEHPKREIMGFDCHRSEVSGRRVWTWAKEKFETPEMFFKKLFIVNYCPLAFMAEGGKNIIPEKLKKSEREPLFEICDKVLVQTVEKLKPKWVIGVGKFAEKRALNALKGMNIQIAYMPHPSPANPAANKGWSKLIDKSLKDLGIKL